MLLIIFGCWRRISFHSVHTQLILLTSGTLSLLVPLDSEDVSSSLRSSADLGLLCVQICHANVERFGVWMCSWIQCMYYLGEASVSPKKLLLLVASPHCLLLNALCFP